LLTTKFYKMKTLFFLTMVLIGFLALSQNADSGIANPSTYLSGLKKEMQIEWPKNRTFNVVFNGHSVLAGYFKTPEVNTFSAYPALVLKKIKALYPYAVVNVIVTAIGGENSASGASRFDNYVLVYQPDILFIDYGLNDLGAGLEKSYKAWDEMIKKTNRESIKVILLTPSPDQRIDYGDTNNELKKHSDQIIRLDNENQVGLVDRFQAFEFLYPKKNKLKKYMSQVNHPNKKGHELDHNLLQIRNPIKQYI
jgi:acyl-CoA thioesterase I